MAHERNYQDFGYTKSEGSHMHEHFMPQVLAFASGLQPGARILDVGCGNGAACGEFIKRGCQVVGLDLSEQGIAIARRNHPSGRFELMAADEDVLNQLNELPLIWWSALR